MSRCIAVVFASFLLRCQALVTLDVSGCFFGGRAAAVADAIRAVVTTAANPLRTLTFSGESDRHDRLQASVARHDRGGEPTLRVTLSRDTVEASFGGMGLGPTGTMLLAAFLPVCSSLRVLNVSNNAITGAVGAGSTGDDSPLLGPERLGAALAAYGGQLESLNIAHNDLGEAGVALLRPAFSSGGLHSLATLTLSGDGADSTAVTMQRDMERANFEGCGLGPAGVMLVAAYLHTCGALRILELADNGLTGNCGSRLAGVAALGAAVSHHEHLVQLNLARNLLGE
jgi:hypothetical protein